jgi:hypothetical protein
VLVDEVHSAMFGVDEYPCTFGWGDEALELSSAQTLGGIVGGSAYSLDALFLICTHDWVVRFCIVLRSLVQAKDKGKDGGTERLTRSSSL